MNILIDTGLGRGTSEYQNVGDVSMLQVAITRLLKLLPRASLAVLTDSPKDLARFCPGTKAVPNHGRTLWFADGVLLGKFRHIPPSWIVDGLVSFRRKIRSRYPRLLRAFLVWRLKSQMRPAEAEAVSTFTRFLQDADLILICGAGGFADGCRRWNLEILDLVETAIQKGTPVVMLGQGFGPLTDASVLRRAAKILPRVNFITLRGNRGAFALLRSLGVAESKIATTGDEALELAYEMRSNKLGHGLGINFRFAGSAHTDSDDIESIRRILRDFVVSRHIPLVPLPIAMHPHSRDDLTINQLLRDLDEHSDGGTTLDSPVEVVKQTSLCRIIVTGAYHAAVFALAQGIPVVALAKCPYYSSKFHGLQDLFGEGCETVLLNEAGFPQTLLKALESAWEKAETLRQPLRTAALKQIALSRSSYERVKELIDRRNPSAFQADHWTMQFQHPFAKV